MIAVVKKAWPRVKPKLRLKWAARGVLSLCRATDEEVRACVNEAIAEWHAEDECDDVVDFGDDTEDDAAPKEPATSDAKKGR